MEAGEFETTNIHLEWLKNIYEQLKSIMSMERFAKEGCASITEYVEIPVNLLPVIIPDVQYKNLRFMALEINLLIDNVSPIISNKVDSYKDRLMKVLGTIDKRELFLQEIKKQNKLAYINVLPLLNTTIDYLSLMKSELIKDISPVLYLDERETKKKW